MELTTYKATAIELEYQVRLGSIAFINGQWNVWLWSKYNPAELVFDTDPNWNDDFYKKQIEKLDWIHN